MSLAMAASYCFHRPMSDVRGGSWDGTERPGYPHRQRVLVLFPQTGEGEADQTRRETYIRKSPGGAWIFAHEGGYSPADGSWDFNHE